MKSRLRRNYVFIFFIYTIYVIFKIIKDIKIIKIIKIVFDKYIFLIIINTHRLFTLNNFKEKRYGKDDE